MTDTVHLLTLTDDRYTTYFTGVALRYGAGIGCVCICGAYVCGLTCMSEVLFSQYSVTTILL